MARRSARTPRVNDFKKYSQETSLRRITLTLPGHRRFQKALGLQPQKSSKIALIFEKSIFGSIYLKMERYITAFTSAALFPGNALDICNIWYIRSK